MAGARGAAWVTCTVPLSKPALIYYSTQRNKRAKKKPGGLFESHLIRCDRSDEEIQKNKKSHSVKRPNEFNRLLVSAPVLYRNGNKCQQGQRDTFNRR